ncbi:MAG: GNAT family N-acetyltransferase [Symploca sp. SIO2G7]|nr:GNAT family N-acetyltransferase [Symploca sp. SIO2G7]
MVSLQKLDASMFDKVYPLLQELDPSLTEHTWQSLFNYRWSREEDYCGYGLFDDQKIVGFIGLLFSKRVINHKVEHFCNLTSWVVKEEYRDHSLSMMLPILRLKNHTITDLSAIDKVVRISKRLGFKELDSKIKVLLSLGIFKSKFFAKNLRFSQDKDIISKTLKDNDLQLFQDHLPYPHCGHLLAYNSSDYCYVIYTVVDKYELSHCYIHYISNPELFSKYSLGIRAKIAKSGHTSIVVVDSRMVRGLRLPLSYELSLLTKLYKSTSLRAEQIDNLYSELMLLNFTTLPINFRELLHKLKLNFLSRLKQTI